MRPLCGPKTEGFFSATLHAGPLCFLPEPGRRGKLVAVEDSPTGFLDHVLAFILQRSHPDSICGRVPR